jgi:hypothetical protein
MLSTDLALQMLWAMLEQQQKRHLNTHPREERKLVNFFGATFIPTVVL